MSCVLITLSVFRYIRFVRKAVTSDERAHFFQSVLWAEMKKSVTYTVDIQVSHEGVIVEGQCECGAGQGPSAHCKHVGATLYALDAFLTTGNLICEQTCTQVRSHYQSILRLPLFNVI